MRNFNKKNYYNKIKCAWQQHRASSRKSEVLYAETEPASPPTTPYRVLFIHCSVDCERLTHTYATSTTQREPRYSEFRNRMLGCWNKSWEGERRRRRAAAIKRLGVSASWAPTTHLGIARVKRREERDYTPGSSIFNNF